MTFKKEVKNFLFNFNRCKKKKELAFNYPFKKELIPFLSCLRQEGFIHKYLIKDKTFSIFLKIRKNKLVVSNDLQSFFFKPIKKKKIKLFLYKNPINIPFVSSPLGVFVDKEVSKLRGGQLITVLK
jgi:ribosomal protein S8